MESKTLKHAADMFDRLTDAYLMHSGRPGQSWYTHKYGKWQSQAVYAQGRPNPDAKVRGKKEISSKQFSYTTNKLIDELNNEWSYGVIHDGKKIEDVSDFDFSKYRTTPIRNLKETKTGICWDFVNYQHAYLNEKGIPNKSYMLVSRYGDNPDDIKTHTFTVAENQGKLYWVESAWWPERGIHNIKSPKEVADKACVFNGKEKPYDLYEFDPTGMDKGLTSNEYFDMATQKLVFTTSDERQR